MTARATTRWRARPILSAILSVAILALPLVGSVAAAVGMGHLLSRRGGVIELVLWWSAVLGASTFAFLILERFGRRLLPLAALLKMTMLFPDQAPKRLKVAWRAASVRDLERHATAGTSLVPADASGEILMLAASLSRHDRATRGHSERVRALTDMIANELGLADFDRDRLRWSALLHDVGKLAVHPETLNKQGQLTEDEWEKLRSHPAAPGPPPCPSDLAIALYFSRTSDLADYARIEGLQYARGFTEVGHGRFRRAIGATSQNS